MMRRLLIGGDGQFTPADLSATKAWWDPEAGITKDGSNLVSSWVDRIGGYDATQATSGKRPTWTGGAGSTVLGNRPCLIFNAKYLEIATSPAGLPYGTTEMWLWTAAKPTTTGAGDAPMFFGYGTQVRAIGMQGPDSPGSGAFACLRAAQSFGFSNGANITNLNAVLGAKFTSTATSGRVNGSASGSDAIGAGSNAQGALVIGARPNNKDNTYIVGYAADMIVTTALTTDERDQMEGYLAWKYGQETSLPSGHPYRYDPP